MWSLPRPVRLTALFALLALLVVLPCLSGILVDACDGDDHWVAVVDATTAIGPTCLLALWCAWGSAHLVIRVFFAAAIWSTLGLLMPLTEIDTSYFASELFFYFAVAFAPLWGVRLAGVTIVNGRRGPGDASPDAEISGARRSLVGPLASRTIRLLATIAAGGLLALGLYLSGLNSWLTDSEEVGMGLTLGLLVGLLAWITLGSPAWWLRVAVLLLLLWFAGRIPNVSERLIFLVSLATGLLGVLGAVRLLGYRLAWRAPLRFLRRWQIRGAPPQPTTVWRDLATGLLVTIPVILTYSFPWSATWLFLVATIHVPAALLAIWSALGSTAIYVRLPLTALACAAWMNWLNQFPSVGLGIDSSQIAQVVCEIAICLFPLRWLGLAIRDRSDSVATAAELPGKTSPGASLRNLFGTVTLFAVLMAINRWTGLLSTTNLLATWAFAASYSAVVASLLWLCQGSGRWWIRLGTFLVAAGIYILLGQFSGMMNWTDALWFSSMTLLYSAIPMAGVLLGFRGLGYRFGRHPWPRASWPSAPPAEIAIVPAAGS